VGRAGSEQAPPGALARKSLLQRGSEPGGGVAVSLCRARRRRGTGKNPSRWAPPRV